VKKFIAKDDADAKRIAAGHGAKSVIKLRGGVPAGKVAEQGVAEGLGKDIKRLATGKDVKSRAGQEIAKSQDASMKGDTKTSKKHFDRYDKLDKLANKEQGVVEAGPFSYGAKKPRKGSVADLVSKKRQEQERGKQPVEPKDQMVGVAKVTKGVAEAANTSHQHHVVSKLDGNVLASYKTKQEAHKNAHGNPVVSGSLETIGDKQYVKEQGAAEGWDPDTTRLEQDVRDALENGDDYTAKQYAKMAPTPEAKKYLLNIIKQAMYIDDLGGETDWKGVAESSRDQVDTNTVWEVCFDYGPHQSSKVKVRASSQEEAEQKGMRAAKKLGHRFPQLNWAMPAEQDVSEVSDNLRNKYVTRASDDYGNANFAARASKSHPGLEKYSKEQEQRAKKRAAGLNRALSDKRTGRNSVAESRLYYNTIGTPDAQLRSDFNLRKDATGWFLKESAAPKVKLAAQRAFGSPKLKEYDLSVPSGPTLTKGDDNVISPVGSVTRKQLGK
jgi:hypothetical protein